VRLVAVADTHTFQDELDVPGGDVFIHAGDLCRGGTLDELAPVAAWIRALPHPTKIVVAGNHDWCFCRERDAALELFGGAVIYLEDSGTDVGGLAVWGSPWQPAFNDWAYNLPRGAALADKWALIPETTDVLITHGPPAGIGDRIGDARRAGCAELLEATRRVAPKLHLFGHIHADGGLWEICGVTYVNATTWECERAPTVIDIDPATGAVTPVYVPERGR
jgi:predicted phosphohydrolase